MTIERKLLGTTPVSSGIEPEGVSFDGHLGNSATDYLLRTTPLTGQADSKTFTVSTFIYWQENTSATLFYLGNNNFNCFLANGGSRVSITAKNASGTTVLRFEAPTTDIVPRNTWVNVQMSFDLSDTSKRHIYVNEVDITAAAFAGSYPKYVDDNIDFTPAAGSGNTDTSYRIGAGYSAQAKFGGRLAHLFFDYTYRDLSIEANKRLFITSDGKPADGQSSVDTASSDFLDISSRGNAYLTNICFNDDGTRLLLGDGGTDDIFQYNLSTAFDLSTASYAGLTLAQGDSTYLQDIQFKDNGTKIYFGGNGSTNAIHQYNLSTANDISTASSFGSKAVSSVLGANRLFITDDGSKMFVGDNYTIAKWNLSTNFNITTASHVNTKVLPYKMSSIQLNANGTEMYLPDPIGYSIVTYTLSTAYDVTTASIKSIKSLAHLDVGIEGAIFNNDGSKLFVAGDDTNKIYEMVVGTNFDATTAVYGALSGSPAAPILYLPLTDAATAGSNSGTGGDFTVNGVLATAERGPNQDNCSASTFNGSNDYLTRASIEAPNSKVFTVSGTINVTGGDGLVCKFYKESHGTVFTITTNIYGSLYIKAYDAAFQNRFYVQWKNSIGANNALMPNHNYHFSLSVDMSDTSKRHLIINGAAVSPTYTYYTDVEMGFSAIDLSRVGFVSGDGYFAGDLGELYFNTTYTDLSTDNPFWDSDANRPNSVRKVIADTSVTPLVALPLMGNDAGNNLGSGGDFNVVSGPFTGARGGSEFWARSADFNGSTGYLAHATALTGAVDNQVFSAMFAFRNSNITLEQNILHTGNGTNHGLSIYQAGNDLGLLVYKDTTDLIMVANTSSGGALFSANTWYVVFVSYDRGNSSNRNIWVNGLDCSSYPTDTEWVSSTGAENIWHDDTNITIGAKDTGTGYYQYHGGDIATLYFNNSYIDFSQEANRNKFVDQLGYPIDLTSAIETGDIPEPLIYMKFDDTAALGTNSGTGGNFTVNGTVTSGADFTP